MELNIHDWALLVYNHLELRITVFSLPQNEAFIFTE